MFQSPIITIFLVFMVSCFISKCFSIFLRFLTNF
nr:MAG TPA: hypothetical protein [Caudoviricetes sp.]